MVDSVKSVASFLDVEPQRLLPTQNVTTSLNTIMNCVQRNDTVVVIRPGYGNLKVGWTNHFF